MSADRVFSRRERGHGADEGAQTEVLQDGPLAPEDQHEGEDRNGAGDASKLLRTGTSTLNGPTAPADGGGRATAEAEEEPALTPTWEDFAPGFE